MEASQSKEIDNIKYLIPENGSNEDFCKKSRIVKTNLFERVPLNYSINIKKVRAKEQYISEWKFLTVSSK